MAFKQDSNLTGLRFAEEASLRTLPDPESDSVWHGLEPNSYSDFGGQLSTLARNPINPSRQRKKGTIVDLDASGGFNQDLTMNNLTRLLQGFFFASIREKMTSKPMNAAANLITSVAVGGGADDDTYNAAAGLGSVLANHLLLASGFTNTANNGIKRAFSASTATTVTVVDTLVAEAAPPAAAKLEVVGYRFADATVDITLNGSLVRLTRVGGTFDLTTLGLLPGEWVFLGGDGSTERFANNVGFARIGLNGVNATYLEFDKVAWTPAAEVGTGRTVHLYFGSVLKNESNPALIVRRTFQLERTLGEDDDGVMSEYLVGAVPNELTINIPQADKVNVDLSFVGLDNEQRTGLEGVKDGSRPALPGEDALNTTSDFARIQLSVVSASDATVAALFAFATEITLTLNNNVSALKAIGVLGGFDTTAGTFEVGGQITAYFADVPAVQAVRNNSDITIDLHLTKANQGISIDVPLLGLGDGRLNVEQDQAITLPLETNAAESVFGHTLQYQRYPYLPTIAM